VDLHGTTVMHNESDVKIKALTPIIVIFTVRSTE